MDIRLALQVAEDNWNDIEWWRETAVPFARRTALAGTLRPYYRFFGPEGDDFMSEDWDNLLILDACRYDMFEKHCDIEGKLEQRTSVGSSTPEFLKKTFRGGSFKDTVYVTANPQVGLRLDPDIFHEVIDVWKTDWNDELGTVEPAPVTEKALEAQEQYPDKRLLVHYMQPHYPFIGETGKSELAGHSGFELTKRLANNEKADRDTATVWDQLKEGELPGSTVWQAYVENLHLALDDIDGALNDFNGKTVITSDHGNLIGERATPFNLEMYGHPTGIHAENLVTVPWLIIDGDSRKSITAEASTGETTSERTDEEEEVIQDRLRDLGYK